MTAWAGWNYAAAGQVVKAASGLAQPPQVMKYLMLYLHGSNAKRGKKCVLNVACPDIAQLT